MGVKGAFDSCQKVITGMVERKWGRIIFISTTIVMPVVPCIGYIIAKGALVGLAWGKSGSFLPLGLL